MSPKKRKTPCTTSSIVCFFFISAVHRNCAGRGDVLGSFRAQGEVEELLGVVGERFAGLGHEDERTLDDIAAVLDGLLGGSYAADRQSLDGILEGCEGSIADGIRVLGDGRDDVTGGGQLLTVLAGILGTGDGFEAVARAGTGFAADEDDLGVIAADLGPVGDLAGVDVGDLLDSQIGDGVFGVHDHGDAVKGNDGPGQGGLLIVLQRAAGQADVAAAFGDGLDAGAGAGRVVGEGHALVRFHEGFAERADDLFHRGRTVSRDRAAVVCLLAAAREQRERHDSSTQNRNDLFQDEVLLSNFNFDFWFFVPYASQDTQRM